MSGTQDNRLNEDLRRERDEPGTTGQEGSGDGGRDPKDSENRKEIADEDKLGSRNVEFDTEDDDATKSEFVPSGK